MVLLRDRCEEQVAGIEPYKAKYRMCITQKDAVRYLREEATNMGGYLEMVDE